MLVDAVDQFFEWAHLFSVSDFDWTHKIENSVWEYQLTDSRVYISDACWAYHSNSIYIFWITTCNGKVWLEIPIRKWSRNLIFVNIGNKNSLSGYLLSAVGVWLFSLTKSQFITSVSIFCEILRLCFVKYSLNSMRHLLKNEGISSIELACG